LRPAAPAGIGADAEPDIRGFTDDGLSSGDLEREGSGQVAAADADEEEQAPRAREQNEHPDPQLARESTDLRVGGQESNLRPWDYRTRPHRRSVVARSRISGRADVPGRTKIEDGGMNGRPLCRMHLAVGRREECPGRECPFWEGGGAVVEPGCSFERIGFEIDARPGVARWLLGIRHALESAHTAEETAATRSSLNAVMPPGLHE
jgi:hypothetical protein